MNPNKSRARRIFLVATGIAAATLIGLFLLSSLRSPKQLKEVRTDAKIIDSSSVAEPGPSSESNRVTRAELTLQRIATKLNSAQSTKVSHDFLMELRATLSSLPASTSSQLAQQFLAGGTDARTHLPFTLGPGGSLQEAPSLRTFLLDYLEQVDPAAAARVGLEVLKRMDSPDEWALALRNIAKFDSSPGNRALLADKMKQMLSHEPWQQNPTIGYLESFDVAVHLGGTDLLPDLTRLLRMTNNQAVAHAAFLATDRLIQRDPAPVLAGLLTDMGMMEGREATRANYFARADVSKSDQRQLIQDYLLNPRTTASELDAFGDVFPNENSMLSNNLLTKNATRTGSEIQARDIQTLQIIKSWLKDPRFKGVAPHLNTIRSRLESFLAKPAP